MEPDQKLGEDTGSQFNSAQLLTDQQIRDLGVPDHAKELFRRTKYQAEFGIDTWYDQLQEYTFKTTQFDLTIQEAEALSRPDKLRNAEDLAQLDGLEGKIDAVLETWRKEGIAAVFVKLSTRSPKDVTVYGTPIAIHLWYPGADARSQDFDNAELQQMIMQEIASCGASPSDRDIVWSFVRATSKGLKVTTGKDAVSLLRRSTRIKEDLSKILQFGEKHFSASIVIREWLDEVVERPHMEFRAFVNQGKLNALSQYFCFVMNPELIASKQKIEDDIRGFFDDIVKKRIAHTAYVIDFYIKRDGKPVVIELNPFHIGAGPCLFSWRTDREKFLNGPFEFRILEEDPEDPFEIIPIRWAKWIRSQLEQRESAQTSSWWCAII